MAWLFEFGDDGDVARMRCDNLFDRSDVGGGADKGKRDRVHAVAEAELQIFAVFFRESWNRQGNAGKIDPFVLAQHAAVDDIAEHVFSSNRADAQFDQAITQQDPGAGREFAGEIGKRGRDARGCAGNVLRSDGDHRAGF
jgi:hypothetical protein